MRLLNKKSVSIHIVTYNSEPYIEDCLQAVFRQSYPIDQIVVIDNASRDRTPEILEQYSERVHVVLNKVNTGFAPGHNQALRMTTSDYFLVLNPDVLLHPDYVRCLIERMEQRPDVGSATGKLLLKSSPDLLDSAGLVIHKSRRAFDRGMGQPEGEYANYAEVFGVSGAAALYSRKMAVDISVNGEFFDEQFFAYKEDVDVAWRAQIYGWSAIYVPEASALHERGWKIGSRQKQPLFVRRHSYINRYRMILKNDSIKYILRHSPSFVWHEILSAGYLILREPGLIKSWGALLRQLSYIKQQRRVIQKNRKKELQKIYSFFQ
ncbi:glycosyltransferase family 2 protein [Paenibacillus residui]|uniref:Glycosyltransferase family 2 protein n=1 Tax=Paenibacillus residui TaxID=629724 RepID=A0ABW3D7X1_9BACL